MKMPCKNHPDSSFVPAQTYVRCNPACDNPERTKHNETGGKTQRKSSGSVGIIMTRTETHKHTHAHIHQHYTHPAS